VNEKESDGSANRALGVAFVLFVLLLVIAAIGIVIWGSSQ